MPLSEKIRLLRQMGAEQGAALYNICFRNAGVGIQWHESGRVETKPPDLHEEGAVGMKEAFRKTRSARSKQLQEGLVIYHYHDTLKEAVDAELERLAD